MFNCSYTRNGLKILEVYYTSDINKIYIDHKNRKYDILKCYQVNEKIPNLQEFHTLQIDLERSIDEIYSNFAKNTRNEINRNMKNDDIEYVINSKVSKENIELFITMFKDFDRMKNLNTNISELENTLIRNIDNLTFFQGLKDSNILVFNIYYHDNIRARLKCSISIRSDNNQERNLIGRTNRALCFKAISHFKENGYKIFDLGGISLSEKDKDKKNIDSFKSKFGGVLVTEYEGNSPLSLKGKLFMLLYKIKNKIR
ncbi:hypothetical protein BB987_17360 [Photorhabdus temperata]|uniref:BioF2-like acetyltransferase domain-containing protein n=1 Tax=Photorhabdus khanii NC19 TaxID=1004151 RepID=W3V9T6_9GAMM|nr:hypothetical protein [Photorhabdus khanii]ETS31895.1 hypothetical protein PTE_01993 [Photorhabdus khanii NC19]OHV51247.1 hypothetical protein BB987_17360 [Photorhabdus temperata]